MYEELVRTVWNETNPNQTGFIQNLVGDVTDDNADTLIAFIHGKVEDAAFDERVAKLRNVEGRPPEEAAAFLAMADRLERQRQQRLSA